MFCTSLRRRPSYASIIPNLVSKSTLGLLENEITTHDIAIPLRTSVNPRTGRTISSRQLRLLLLSPSRAADKHLFDTVQRIRHFTSLTAARDIAILFLLDPPRETSFQSAKRVAGSTDDTDSSTAGMLAYAKLQSELMNHVDIPHIPILPLPKIEGLPRLLKLHVGSLTAPQAPREGRQPAVTTMDILSMCTANPPMQQQTAYIVSDIFPNLRELARVCTTFAALPSSSVENQKLQQLQALVGGDEVRNIIDFWKMEYAID